VLSLEGNWQPCIVHNGAGRFLRVSGGVAINSGMSGSRILDGEGAAIGLIPTGTADQNLNPNLTDCLPPWLLRKLGQDEVKPPRRKLSRSVGGSH
jgi:hypothetical protein